MSAECSAGGVPLGYKKTEVGVIPEDWKVKSIGDLVSISVGRDLKEENYSTYQDNIFKYPVFSNTVTSEGLYGFYNIPEYNGESLTVVGRGVGLGTAFARKGGFGAIGRLLVLFPVKNVNTNFLTEYINNKVNIFTESAGIPQLTGISIAKYRIPIPPTISEQEAVAESLFDADALIKSLEQLITKKRHIKQGAMQELLTGKRRLPGFSGEWETKLLGEVIVSCSSGATPYRGRPDYYKGKVKWITSGELNYNLITDTLEHISNEAVEHTNLKIHPIGTFLMAITGLEAAGTRGACGIVGSPATTNQSCMAIYPTSELKTEYLYHYYVFRGNELALQYCQGTKQQSYTAKLVKLLPIDLPPTVEEQESIASILSDMDSEITALEEKLAKARQIKQGMMQELLTGRVRLI